MDSPQRCIMAHIEAFLLDQLLPLLQQPRGAAAADVEAVVSDELLSLHLANSQLTQRLSKW
jgi:hypothetical protein